MTKQKYPQFCQQLIKWIEENLYEKLKAIENKEIEDKIKSEEEEQQQNKMVNENTQWVNCIMYFKWIKKNCMIVIINSFPHKRLQVVFSFK